MRLLFLFLLEDRAMKRIITIQDISCVGKCSIGAALPIISAAGVEASVLPSAVLSTHTAFPEYTFRSLSDEFKPISDTFTSLGIGFDAIYTGYLGSFNLLWAANRFISQFKADDTLLLVDPVMGDRGKLYQGFWQEYTDCMAMLCSKADLILPNLTEASYLIHVPYNPDYNEAYIRGLLISLTDRGTKRAAITGIGFESGKTGFYFYDSKTREFYSYFCEKLPAAYHGTGDVFASCALGGIMRGLDFPAALTLAEDFTQECIRQTLSDPERRTYGVSFERVLPMLINRLSAEGRGGNP